MSIQREDDPALYDHLRSGRAQAAVDLHPRDLESIVTTLEMAVLDLAPVVGAEFTHEALMAQARDIAPDIRERDCNLVLAQMGYIVRRRPGRRYAVN